MLFSMVIIDYKKKFHKQIILACVKALREGKIIAYPTDTSYGLAADAENIGAIAKLYRIKGRNFNKPIHVVVPNEQYAKKLVKWNKVASNLAKKFWPGAITLVLELKAKGQGYKLLSAGNGTIGLRMPNNLIALDIVKYLKHPITATSANVSGQPDIYSVKEMERQFSARGKKNKNYQPDLIINAGKLARIKPSTVIKIDNNGIQILRKGPITSKQIFHVA